MSGERCGKAGIAGERTRIPPRYQTRGAREPPAGWGGGAREGGKVAVRGAGPLVVGGLGKKKTAGVAGRARGRRGEAAAPTPGGEPLPRRRRNPPLPPPPFDENVPPGL